MLEYTEITNVSCVDFNGCRLWARYILINAPFTPSKNKSFEVRQIRGFTNGGLSVFTVWIDPQEDVIIENNSGGNFVLFRNNSELVNLDSGVSIITKNLKLDIFKEDHSKAIAINKINVDSCPYGSAVDEQILKYYQAPNYCITTYVKKEEALYLSRRLQCTL